MIYSQRLASCSERVGDAESLASLQSTSLNAGAARGINQTALDHSTYDSDQYATRHCRCTERETCLLCIGVNYKWAFLLGLEQVGESDRAYQCYLLIIPQPALPAPLQYPSCPHMTGWWLHPGSISRGSLYEYLMALFTDDVTSEGVPSTSPDLVISKPTRAHHSRGLIFQNLVARRSIETINASSWHPSSIPQQGPVAGTSPWSPLSPSPPRSSSFIMATTGKRRHTWGTSHLRDAIGGGVVLPPIPTANS